jgi:thiosulfate/3-mercaptopyruvate sulfurtransferase
MQPLVTTAWLAEHLGEPELRVADVRWYLDPARRGRDAYAAGHIPGAVFLDVDEDLSAPGGGRGQPAGRHPWPGPDQVARGMGAAGIGPGTRVVAYDDQAGAVAGRLWYLLRAYGHDAVAVLDGGIVKWTAEGRPLEAGPVPPPAPAAFLPRPREGWVVSKGALAAESANALVLDARAAERYRGETEPIDPRAGHVPGARNAPYAANLTPGPVPVFRPPAELRARYAALGAEARAPIVYCGSGVTACHDLLALELAGLSGRLYAGSWSEWSADPTLPVATGEEP